MLGSGCLPEPTVGVIPWRLMSLQPTIHDIVHCAGAYISCHNPCSAKIGLHSSTPSSLVLYLTAYSVAAQLRLACSQASKSIGGSAGMHVNPRSVGQVVRFGLPDQQKAQAMSYRRVGAGQQVRSSHKVR